MECDQVSTWLDAYIDLELEPQRAAELVAHVRECARCAASVIERQRLRSSLIAGMTFNPAPPTVVKAIHEALSPSRRVTLRPAAPRWAWGALAASLLLAGLLVWNLVSPLRFGTVPDTAVREVVSAHIRSLMGAHLADIAVSDQHTVKPWFAGKLDFSPRVIDYAGEGFPLAGGRLDYLDGHPAAAVIYKRRAHVINLFSYPDAAARQAAPQLHSERGYHTIDWSGDGVRYWAVSDVNPEELMTFVQLVRSEHAPK